MQDRQSIRPLGGEAAYLSERPSRLRPFDRPALDKRAGRAEYRNDDGDSSAPVLCRGRGGG